MNTYSYIHQAVITQRISKPLVSEAEAVTGALKSCIQILDEDRWIQGSAVKAIKRNNQQVTGYCLIGMAGTLSPSSFYRSSHSITVIVENYIMAAIKKVYWWRPLCWGAIVMFNDSPFTTKKQVMKVLKMALQLAQQDYDKVPDRVIGHGLGSRHNPDRLVKDPPPEPCHICGRPAVWAHCDNGADTWVCVDHLMPRSQATD